MFYGRRHNGGITPDLRYESVGRGFESLPSHQTMKIHSLVLFNFGEKRQAMPVLIHTGPQRRKSLRDFPLRLLVEGSAPKPL